MVTTDSRNILLREFYEMGLKRVRLLVPMNYPASYLKFTVVLSYCVELLGACRVYLLLFHTG